VGFVEGIEEVVEVDFVGVVAVVEGEEVEVVVVE